MTESHENPDQRRSILEEWEGNHLNQPPNAATHRALRQPPILAREIVALGLLVLLCDLTLYRSHGFAGTGVLFLIAPLLLFLGTVRLKVDVSIWLLIPLLVLLSIRLVWCGSDLAVAVGFALLCCFAMSLSGLRPYLTRAVVFASHLIAAGHRGLHHYFQSLSRFSPAIRPTHRLAVVLPVMTVLAFATIFVMANPDLVASFGESFRRIVETLERWIYQLEFTEILFCLGVGWIAVGLLRPNENQLGTTKAPRHVIEELTRSPFYDAYRNTLVAVIGLFAVYLVFEFETLWFKTFPKRFYYSGYAQEGATWLTVALGLATITLSLIFRGTILADPRLVRLRTLSWIWSIENLLLAVAVFNRLFIYVGFNGMTRMRVVGMLGVASVVCGFLLVLRKISRNEDFVWLIRRQLWTVAFAVLPVDAFVNQFNVDRILAGNFAPSVQVSVHPTSDEGELYLKPLIHCSNEIIREGVRALLDDKLNELEIAAVREKSLGWTTTQFASHRLLEQLRTAKLDWQDDGNAGRRAAALKRFHDYAYQWY